MVANGGVATVGERAGASVAYARDIVWVSTEIPSDNFGHETAVIVSDDLPDNLIVLHLCK